MIGSGVGAGARGARGRNAVLAMMRGENVGKMIIKL
ncbi:NADPH-dependent curcumin reductase CurA [Streptomyces sp. SAI-127]|nr:NADPH-dependent curcumin reductase CurA [Streptomyces sp. SAI-127]